MIRMLPVGAFRVVFRKPRIGRVPSGEDLEVIGVADQFACGHGDKDAHFKPCPSSVLEFTGSLESPTPSAHRSLRFSFAVRL
jgi:hypothetical protein